jgi:hypothetical protein
MKMSMGFNVNIPWPKGSQTPTEMNVLKHAWAYTFLEKEKKELLMYLEKVNASSSLSRHPFFGTLNRQRGEN